MAYLGHEKQKMADVKLNLINIENINLDLEKLISFVKCNFLKIKSIIPDFDVALLRVGHNIRPKKPLEENIFGPNLEKLPDYIPLFIFDIKLINRLKENKKIRDVTIYFIHDKKILYYGTNKIPIAQIKDFVMNAESEQNIRLTAPFNSFLGIELFKGIGEMRSLEEIENKLDSRLPRNLNFEILIRDFQDNILETSVTFPLR